MTKQGGHRQGLLFLLLCTLLGIVGGQILGTFLVAKSNAGLWLEQQTIARFGYLAVPGQLLEMKAISTYLAGGLFFALSIGLGYGFFCGLLAFFQKKWRFLPFAWLIIIVLWKGWSADPAVLVFLLLVPLLIYVLSLPLLSGVSLRLLEAVRYGLLFLVFLILLVVTFRHLDFIKIRDRVLLPTRVGQKIDKFYYHYTLYPARLVQPLNYRLQNLVVLNNFPKAQLSRVQTILRRHDWFAIVNNNSDFQAQTRIVFDKSEDLLFYANPGWPNKKEWKNKPYYRVSYQAFLQNPSTHLKQYSLAADPFTMLRMGCGISLFFIVPLALALGLFVCCICLIQLPINRLKMGKLKETAALLGLILVILAGLNFYLKASLPQNPAKLWLVATGKENGDRIAALQRLEKSPKSCRGHREDIILLSRDQSPVIRRFGAEFLGHLAVGDKTIPLLVSMLHDSNINVVYTAAESLAKIPKTRDILLKILTSNREWYIKLKAYYALKRTGWHQ